MSEISERRLVIACGGTGGHLFPGIAVAESWVEAGGEVLLLISEKQIDSLASEGYGHLQFERMSSMAMPRVTSPKIIPFLAKFIGSLFSCRRLLRRFRAEAVLGMGGFTSAAPLLAGRMLGLPTFVHESNAIPGRANRLNARFSRTILVGFETCAGAFGDGKPVKVVGTPLRPSMRERSDKESAREHFGLDPNRRTVLVMGGSQGARRINQLVAASLPAFVERQIQVLQISGPLDHEMVRPAHEENPDAGVLLSFCREMQTAYAAADLAICRSGASTLTELSYYGTPSILIPYPFAADDHQARNAEIFSEPGAAVCWPQEDLNEENFAERVLALAGDDETLETMSARMVELAIPDAADKVAQEIVASVA